MKIKKFAGALLFLVGCGDVDAASSTTPCADASTPQDASADAPTAYHLTIRFIAPRDNRGVEHARAVWVQPDGRIAEQEFMPTVLQRMENGNYDYEPVDIQLDVPAPEITFNIGWSWHYSDMYPIKTASLSLFHIRLGGAYFFSGQVIVMDQTGRHWLGYPAVIEYGLFEGYLRFVPEDTCRPGYPRRRDDICWR